jgi:hypothetical protein
LNAHDESYSRNASCEVNQISSVLCLMNKHKVKKKTNDNDIIYRAIHCLVYS